MAGTESTPEDRRFWAGVHHVYSDYLTRPYHVNKLAQRFYQLFSVHLEEQPINEWRDTTIYRFLKFKMAESAVISLDGTKILELNPGFLNIMWEFDEVALGVILGAPKWLNRRPWMLRDRFHDACERYLESAWENFDWSKPNSESDWDEHFGSRFAREFAKWFKEHGFSTRGTAGAVSLILFG
jgi:hypothetical protein